MADHGSGENTVISARNLDLTFETNDGPVHALKDITLDIAEGEFVSLIGPSGCGPNRPALPAPMAMCSSRQRSCPGAPSRIT